MVNVNTAKKSTKPAIVCGVSRFSGMGIVDWWNESLELLAAPWMTLTLLLVAGLRAHAVPSIPLHGSTSNYHNPPLMTLR
jgi:hypothetical protein